MPLVTLQQIHPMNATLIFLQQIYPMNASRNTTTDTSYECHSHILTTDTS